MKSKKIVTAPKEPKKVKVWVVSSEHLASVSFKQLNLKLQELQKIFKNRLNIFMSNINTLVIHADDKVDEVTFTSLMNICVPQIKPKLVHLNTL